MESIVLNSKYAIRFLLATLANYFCTKSAKKVRALKWREWLRPLQKHKTLLLILKTTNVLHPSSGV